MQALKHAIVLTGGIATGKSSAAEYFRSYGFEIVDADKIAHRMLDDQAGQIAKLFGAQFLSGGKVDRKALGSVVFADSHKRKVLESLLHPLIREEVAVQAEKLEQESTPYLIDLPLFFESGAYPFEQVIVVYAPREIQLQRLMAREGYDEAEALRRIDAQMDIEQKRIQATYLIDNSGERTQLEQECLRVRDLILKANRV